MSNYSAEKSQTAIPLLLPFSPSSASLIYTQHPGKEVDDHLLDRCAQLFSENYGIWGHNLTVEKAPRPGSRVKMNGRRLRLQPGRVGHVFATVWDFDGGRIGWVTQLVVSLAMRKRYIATQLIQMLKSHPIFDGITAIGLASSHPSACHALSKYTDVSIRAIDKNFCQQNVKAILARSPIEYVRDMQLHGSLFEDNCTSGAISSAFTNFYIDHAEPLEALATYKACGNWVLGELLEGHEFLIILPARA